ncbi:MAG: hypothetical protein QNK04_01120 [Myxococcota bacterium]|nr:hypothetical protein [Myxococcota bacterium]
MRAPGPFLVSLLLAGALGCGKIPTIRLLPPADEYRKAEPEPVQPPEAGSSPAATASSPPAPAPGTAGAWATPAPSRPPPVEATPAPAPPPPPVQQALRAPEELPEPVREPTPAVPIPQSAPVVPIPQPAVQAAPEPAAPPVSPAVPETETVVAPAPPPPETETVVAPAPAPPETETVVAPAPAPPPETETVVAPAPEPAPVLEPVPEPAPEARVARAPRPAPPARVPTPASPPRPVQDLDPKQVAQGREVYVSYCATCHGDEGRGDGPLGASLLLPPSDLTRFAARRGGSFRPGEVAAHVDGRLENHAHGTAGDPIWGRRFTSTDTSPSPEVARLIAYLESIQASDGTEPSDGARAPSRRPS